MREATEKEFNQALSNAQWPRPERCYAGRCEDYTYKDMEGIRGLCGTDVAHKTVINSRGKQSQVLFSVNPDYLDD